MTLNSPPLLVISAPVGVLLNSKLQAWKCIHNSSYCWMLRSHCVCIVLYTQLHTHISAILSVCVCKSFIFVWHDTHELGIWEFPLQFAVGMSCCLYLYQNYVVASSVLLLYHVWLVLLCRVCSPTCCYYTSYLYGFFPTLFIYFLGYSAWGQPV